jgi:hypothetical protein
MRHAAMKKHTKTASTAPCVSMELKYFSKLHSISECHVSMHPRGYTDTPELLCKAASQRRSLANDVAMAMFNKSRECKNNHLTACCLTNICRQSCVWLAWMTSETKEVNVYFFLKIYNVYHYQLARLLSSIRQRYLPRRLICSLFS